MYDDAPKGLFGQADLRAAGRPWTDRDLPADNRPVDRLAVFVIPYDLLAKLLGETLSGKEVAICNLPPEGAVVVRHAAGVGAFCLVMRHESFPEVREGDAIPVLLATEAREEGARDD